MSTSTLVSANWGWPSWRTPAGNDPADITLGSARSRGFRISYEDHGSGPPIVLVPGYTMLAADWREMGYTQALAATRRVIVVDPLGHGLSDRPHEREDYLWPHVARDVIAVLDAAGVDRAPIWGYSRGSSLAAVAAIDYPDRVSALVLGGEDLLSPPDPLRTGDWADRLWHGDWSALWGVMPGPREDVLFAAECLDPRALGAVNLGGRMSGFGRSIRLDRIGQPALVYGGEHDDPALVARTAAALGVPFHHLDDLDHIGAFVARDTVLPLVESFLEDVAPKG